MKKILIIGAIAMLAIPQIAVAANQYHAAEEKKDDLQLDWHSLPDPEDKTKSRFYAVETYDKDVNAIKVWQADRYHTNSNENKLKDGTYYTEFFKISWFHCSQQILITTKAAIFKDGEIIEQVDLKQAQEFEEDSEADAIVKKHCPTAIRKV